MFYSVDLHLLPRPPPTATKVTELHCSVNKKSTRPLCNVRLLGTCPHGSRGHLSVLVLESSNGATHTLVIGSMVTL